MLAIKIVRKSNPSTEINPKQILEYFKISSQQFFLKSVKIKNIDMISEFLLS
jgi:hypothetical protein